ncbi:xanthine dehydrogenase family protein molybdopterin-binding subunit [Sphingomonas jatrophae]|uniref:Xanthine dehydrogenase YagR molybdenum-binding subunit n=1 Tax=Sphingomonas jatrophae TaxID=1166337 RepID=A0A1I6LE03_9SPHN|nr:xanthine dehydrogenase family protein molybdopterin-binding subunit [Sphingomonas jatrophae]SFS01732.1 xanthine dehydrogenase YagR molybdenum-binding subunit [Sphingomonas jatrophae]
MSSTTATLRMNAKQGLNRADHAPQGLIGAPLDRKEGPLKVSGRAPYAYEHHPANVAFGYLVTATIARGKVNGYDFDAALAVPGVVAVIDAGKRTTTQAANTSSNPEQGNDHVTHYGQPLLMVVADTFEAAREAAAKVRVDYAPEEGGRFVLAEEAPKAKTPGYPFFNKANMNTGDFDGAFATAPVQVDATYTTPSQIHAAMEPHAATASWDEAEGKLTIHASYQMIGNVAAQLAKVLGIKADKIHLMSPYVGGGFGSKLGLNPESVMAAVAARALKRPVKIAITRQQLFGISGRRSDSIQRIRLGAEADGRILAIAHESLVSNRDGETFYEPAGISTPTLYAGENRLVSHRQAAMDLMISVSMRAPGEAIGMLALESAMDELAHTLGLDPVELRLRNEPDTDPQAGTPFSTRKLAKCLTQGAEAFGWAERKPQPGARREGDWLVGLGVAALSRNNYLSTSSARVRLTPAGTAEIETDHTDIGTGTYTILAQVAGDVLGLPMDAIEVRLGDSTLPKSSGSGGSWGAASGASSVLVAAEALIEQIAKRLGVEADQLTFKDGQVITGNRTMPLADAVGPEPLEAEGTIQSGAVQLTHTQVAYGAVFAEVAVNAVTGEIRVRRLDATLAAGRILNPKTARSQVLGGLIWGMSGALMEEAALDERRGVFVNHDLAEYHVPVNADAPAIDVTFLEEDDRYANPLGVKGIGELGICGSGAAIANAVFNATGVRVRDFPITLDKLLDGLPD